jgi:adenosylcobyric acid synthase
MTARVLMIQGTSSSVGKSLLTAALCRIFARKGVRVAPFKAQNMSNNAAVCPDGSEIGRAQAVQAAAAGIEPGADMNPVLLKPEAEARCQVIVEGRPWKTLPAGSYYRKKEELWTVVTAAFNRLRAVHELVIIEGAGSPVELNLRSSDIVNMTLARHGRAPVLLVGDIDRGGIFAQMLGTLWLLTEEERRLVRGLIINKFRGDPTLFADGMTILEERGKVPVLGVVPYLPNLAIPEEDAVALDRVDGISSGAKIDVALIRLPRIANFDDFDPLRAEPGVRLRYVTSAANLGCPDAIILPGTKSTIADLLWLREHGLVEVIRRLASEGTAVVGICGGYQMLGRVIRDPDRVESSVGEIAGLGLLPAETVFATTKATHQVQATIQSRPGWLKTIAGEMIKSYEIHMGSTWSETPWLEITRGNGVTVQRTDGAVSDNGRIWGCYLHGLFANEAFRRAWLASLGPMTESERRAPPPSLQEALNRLADAVEAGLDMRHLEEIIFRGAD